MKNNSNDDVKEEDTNNDKLSDTTDNTDNKATKGKSK